MKVLQAVLEATTSLLLPIKKTDCFFKTLENCEAENQVVEEVQTETRIKYFSPNANT